MKRSLVSVAFLAICAGAAFADVAPDINRPTNLLKIVQAGCVGGRGINNGYECYKTAIPLVIEGKGRYGVISGMCNAAAGDDANGWKCFKEATAMAIALGDTALGPIDSACRAAAGSDHGGYRCFSRAYADLARQERWGNADAALPKIINP